MRKPTTAAPRCPDSNSQAAFSRHLFSRQVPHPAGSLPFSSCGGWNRTNIKTFRASHPAVRRPRKNQSMSKARGEGVEPPQPGSKPGGLPLADPRSRSALRESNSPIQLGRLAPLPIGQGHMKRKERESNPQGFRSTVFETAAVANRLALPLELRRQESNL
jgi:hypothetical protein